MENFTTQIWVQFDRRSLKNNYKSDQEGRPIYDDVVFITKIIPGDQTTKIERPVHDSDKREFPIQWAAFVNGDVDQPVDGTPIKEWQSISRSQAEELNGLGFRTVEQIANASDNQMARLMGGQSLKVKAQAFIASAKSSAAPQQLAVENKALKDRMEAMEHQMNEMASLLNESQKRKPGRHPKIVSENV